MISARTEKEDLEDTFKGKLKEIFTRVHWLLQPANVYNQFQPRLISTFLFLLSSFGFPAFRYVCFWRWIFRRPRFPLCKLSSSLMGSRDVTFPANFNVFLCYQARWGFSCCVSLVGGVTAYWHPPCEVRKLRISLEAKNSRFVFRAVTSIQMNL